MTAVHTILNAAPIRPEMRPITNPPVVSESAMVIGIVVALLGVLAGADGALIISGIVNGLMNMVMIAVVLAVLAGIHRQLAGAANVTDAFE